MPDMLLVIFDILENEKASLASAAVVNLAWSPLALGVLWRDPAPRALFGICSRGRQQYYAAKIRRLLLTNGSIPPADDNSPRLCFSRLTTLYANARMPCARLQHFLPPSLTALDLSGRPAPELGALLWAQCPQLRSVVLNCHTSNNVRGADKDLSVVAEFLQLCPLPLRQLELHGFVPDCSAATRLFRHLARRWGLADLRVVHTTGRAAFQGALDLQDAGEAAFVSLRRLLVNLAPQHVVMLPLVAPSLTSLSLTFVAVDSAHLAGLAQRTVQDEFISNGLFPASPLSYHALAPLRQFRSLRELSISSSTHQPLLLTDDEFDSLLESLPRLQRFLLVVREGMSGLSGAALRSIGERCRDLVTLEMSGAWDLSHLRKSSLKYIFPKLAVLRLQTASAEREHPETGG
jgi:hypothetical protein